jgi:hypothetical protein
MATSSDDTTNTIIHDPIRFCLDVLLKEAREENRLIKQILYTMLSAATNNPINLAINSPSGEGKTYVLQKVGQVFPKNDIMFLAGMTEKALFHRHGPLVVKNENGEYESIEDKISKIDSEIQDKQCEIQSSKDRNLKQGLKSQITDLEKQRTELLNNAKKLIDLSHKTLVFLESPRPELFSALMPLLSHDKYEVEYEYADKTNNGIKTKSNILRGWPAVIFAQAFDYSHYQRYPEIQRRFIITNPKMTTQKYEQAIDLISDKYGLPDFAYQEKVVSDSDKDKVREIIADIIEKIREVCDRVEPGKNNVFIPFSDTLKELLPKQQAFNMTTANRFFGFLSLLPIINIDERPKIVRRKKGNPIAQTIPFALFEDLDEAIYLMQYANGVRPYILEWYYEVFLQIYNAKTTEDSKVDSKGNTLTEKRLAVTTDNLIDKTFEVYNKKLSSKQILQTYITPLINENYIDSMDSELDKRAKIYYPVLSTTTTKYSKLFLSEERNNISQTSKIIVKDSSLYPDKQYIFSKIQQVLGYSSEKDFIVEIKNHKGNEITSVEELVNQYYSNLERNFQLDNDDDNKNKVNVLSAGPDNDGDDNKDDSDFNSIHENSVSVKEVVSEYYLRNEKIANENDENQGNNMKNIDSKEVQSKKLFLLAKWNNLLYSCYYCDNFETNIKQDYERHVVLKHPGGKLCYPSKVDLEILGIEGKGKEWEI